MLKKETLDELQARLRSLDEQITAHPLGSDAVKTAQAMVDAMRDDDRDEVDRCLAEQGLPSLAELGRIQVSGTASWWSLHRNRNRVSAKIAKLKHR